MVQRNSRAILFVALFEFLSAGLIIYIIIQSIALNKQLLDLRNVHNEMKIRAQELHISSDELTRTARTYVITSDPIYKQAYYNILAVRDGTLERPKDPFNIYWDLNKEQRQTIPKGDKKSFQKILSELPFTALEREKLILSETRSNELVNLEVEAFNAIKGVFLDANGDYTVHKEPDQAYAIRILHSKQYHHAKSHIMEPIEEFFILLTTRMNSENNQLHKHINQNSLQLGILFILLLLGNIYIYFFLTKKEKQDIDQVNLALQYAQAKSQFLANMSHEIRTPLNAILGFIDLLHKEVSTEKARKYLSTIQHSSQGLLKIIEDILDLSKVENDKLVIDPIDFDIRGEMSVVTELFKLRASEKNIIIQVEINENVPTYIHSDPLRIKQVLINLINNALKFSPENSTILITIEHRDNKLYVAVKDEGKGIAKEKQSMIFEAFTQEDNSTTREYGGTGLGLTISSKLLNLMDGELKLKSTLGQGSTFYFTIEAPEANAPETPVYEETKHFQNQSILLVEDNKSNQLLMQIILEEFNLKPTLADDGKIGYELFTKQHFDLVLMDENMPNMSGIECTRAIRAYEAEQNKKATPIVALTANAIKGSKERMLEAGMNDFLSKPIDTDALNKILCHYFSTTQV